jgi:hypothetical protein
MRPWTIFMRIAALGMHVACWTALAFSMARLQKKGLKKYVTVVE